MFSFPGSVMMSQLRQNVTGYLPATAIIQSVTNVSDGAGGFTETWAAVGSGTVAARILPMTFGQIEILAMAEGVRVEYVLILPYNAPISVGNRASVGGTAYNVRWMQPDVSNIMFVKAYLSRDV